MTSSLGALHVYRRDVHASQRSSLAVLAGWISPGARVLDLGCGSGALGRHLLAQGGCTIDGLTYNPEEAELAADAYRRVEVADLDTCDLALLFGAERYDHIVCADVLEHLRAPERVMLAARDLLAPGGQMLISVPNAGYAGLIAELLGGEFRYRAEGLLDRTHLRFYTRRSLLRFIETTGWAADEIDHIARALPDSEFSTQVDALPPAVARHLLTAPDALTYQFLVRARPADADVATGPASGPAITHAPPRAQAHFTAQLYRRRGQAYAEADKQTVRGVMGEPRQTLRFDLPAGDTAASALRFDPADRPGYLHLHGMRLTGPDGTVHWTWSGRTEDLAAGPHEQLSFRAPWNHSAPALLLLLGDDPFFQLPIPEPALAAAAGGSFEADVGWPMSADYLQVAGVVGDLEGRVRSQKADLAEAHASVAAVAHALGQHQVRVAELQRGLDRSEAALRQLQAAHDALREERDELRRAHDALEGHFERYHRSFLYRASRPVSRAKWLLLRLLRPGRRATEPAPVDADDVPSVAQIETNAPAPAPTVAEPAAQPAITPNEHPVDVIVPVYRGLQDTQRCLASVLRGVNRTPFRLLLVNDGSPEPEVTAYLRGLAGSDPRIELLENERNLGFIRSVNRGMAASAERDVVLLNSDTEVAGDWLDRLRRAAYTDARVGTVTPFSNNATICSYPRFCEDNRLPEGYDTAALDALFARENPGQVLPIPTGIGFCLYIRRDCLSETGPFDADLFGEGYGEEGEFCMRAGRQGWRHLLALDTFVWHAGGVSFGASKRRREREAQTLLDRLHPQYPREVQTHIAQDPARPARLAVDLARLQARPRPAVLMVLHAQGGGTERHVRELNALLRDRVNVFSLRPAPGGELLLAQVGSNEGFGLVFRPTEDGEVDALVHALQGLGVCHVHIHHLLGHDRALIATLPERLGVAYDVTVHDHLALCPQITLTDETHRYCGERGLSQCHGCLDRRPASTGENIESWRAAHRLILQGARHVFAPSHDAAQRVARLAPDARVVQVPHADIAPGTALPVPTPRRLQAGEPLRIVVIGALSEVKGADLLEETAELAAREGLPLEFHLVGHAWRPLSTQPRARLTVHGAYKEQDLPALLAWLKPDVAWFPAQWPETYCYTLSACLMAGLPVVAPDLGAFRERLAGRPWTWVRPWAERAPAWLDYFDSIRREHFASGIGPERTPPGPRLATANGRPHAFVYEQDYLRGVDVSRQPAGLTKTFIETHHH